VRACTSSSTGSSRSRCRNYSLGIREQIIFPEINYDDIQQVRGLDVTITTTAETDDQARALLKALGLPFSGDGDRRDQ
jgi:large subunit ribosomal protein L5